jgi:hypothetical protein
MMLVTELLIVWMAKGKNYEKQQFVLYDSTEEEREVTAVFLLSHHSVTHIFNL